MTPATDRPRIVYELTKKIVEAFSQSPDVDFALPYVFSQRTGMQMRHQSRMKEPFLSSERLEFCGKDDAFMIRAEGV